VKRLKGGGKMTDDEIIGLFNSRNESAVKACQEKYGSYCQAIAGNILTNPQDSEECLNDALYKVWNAIPPAQPKSLKAFLGRITRNQALDAYDYRGADKRGGGQVPLAMDEIEEFIGAEGGLESAFDSRVFASVMNSFLAGVPEQQRIIFLKRYLYFEGIDDIAAVLAVSASKVKSVLFRLRKKLRDRLIKEGILS
jgi:RNA polymerase sigma-70 factor (ECF subfamily)